jgi:Flp pilus assembly protein TadD
MLWQTILRVVLVLMGLFGCYRLTVDSARTGYARLLCTLAIITSSLEPADSAVKISPNDPETQYTRALALVNVQRLPEAETALRQAVALRPHHYYQWLDLGVTLDRLDNQEGALVALRECIRLAPRFAQPRWQMGSLLYRQGKYPEAFSELRLGAQSNSKLFDALVDLAWLVSDGDETTVEQFVQPRTTANRLELANYLARHGRGAAAVRQVKQAGALQDELDRRLSRQTIASLLTSKQFSDAYAVWALTHSAAIKSGANPSGQILNGDFVDSISQNDPGFGWQLTPETTVAVAIDALEPASGTRSILLSFNGESAPGIPLLYQLVLVEPKTRYSLRFKASTKDLVTGGPPVVVVIDADSAKALGQSSTVPAGTNPWTENQVDFSTDEKTSAVMISLQRINCSQTQCPVFGRLWLGRFSLSKS